MDALHLHLIVNHIPIFAGFFAVPLLTAALLSRRDTSGLLLAAALLLAAGGVAAVVASESGEHAEEVVEHLAGVSEHRIEGHEEAAEVAVPFAVASGILGLLAVGFERLAARPLPRGALLALLVLASITAGVMGRAGASGGLIRHTELDDTGRVAAPAVLGLARTG